MRAWFAGLLCLCALDLTGQTLQVRLDSCPTTGLLHAHRVHPITGHLHCAEVGLVEGRAAEFATPVEEGEVWLLESPPWAWQLTTRAGEPDRAVLTCPSDVPLRLRKVYGTVAWERRDGSPSDHPEPAIEALQVADYQELRELEYDLLSATGAVGQRASLVEDSVWEAATERMEAHFDALNAPSEWVEDAVLRERLRWAVATGASDSLLRAIFLEALSQTPRHPCELLASPAFVSSAELALQLWWEPLDATELEEAVKAGTADELMGPVGASEALRTWAWWVLARAYPQSRLVTRAFANWSGPDCFLQALRELIVPHVPVPPVAWTTRSGELENIQEFCAGKRTVLLIVKDGSAIALRERALFGQLAESNRRKDVQFVVVSIDGTQGGWDGVQADRSSRSESVRWMGNDPRALEAWQISTVPQVVVLGPDGDVLPMRHRLPSEGLGADMERWPH